MIIPLLLLSLSTKQKVVVPPFSSITISPFYANGTTTVVVETSSKNLHFSVFIQNDLYMNRAIISDTITKPGTRIYKYDNSSSRPKNKVFIRYYTNDPTASVDSEHFDRNLTRGRYQYIEDNRAITTASDLVVVKSDGSYTTRNLTYGFDGFDGLYVPSYYHKIDLADFAILANRTEAPFFSCKPSLVIKNYNGIFDDVEGANESVTFNLKTKAIKLGYTFELEDDLYVDRETLRLSSTQKEGYVKTKYIYFPINEMQNQNKFECNFVLSEFGIDKDMLFHSFELRALRNTFGDCSNSKYCISTLEL